MCILEKEYKAILDGASDAIYVTDMDYNLLYANEVARSIGRKLFDTDLGEGKCYYCLLGRDTPCSFCKMDRMSREQYLVRRFEGATGRTFQLRGKLINWNGKPAHIEYIKNITEQEDAVRKTEELTIQQENLYRHIGAGMCLYLYKDGELYPLICNDDYRSLFILPKNFDAKEGIKLELKNFQGIEKERAYNYFMSHVQSEKAFQKSFQMRNKDNGFPQSVLIKAEPVHQEDGSCLWYVTAFDITEWKERDLQLNNILAGISGGIASYKVSRDGSVKNTMYTDGLPAMQGYTNEEYEALVEEDALMLCYPDDRERLKQEIAKALKNQSVLSTNYRVLHKEKECIWVNLTASPAGTDGDGDYCYHAAFTNVSQQFELYRTMLDITETAMMVTDRESREVYFTNKIADDLIDTARKELQIGNLFPPQSELSRKVNIGDRIFQVYVHSIDWMGRPSVAQYFADITEEIMLQERIASDEERYRKVVEKSGIALMDYRVLEDEIYMNEEFHRYAVSQLPNIKEYLDAPEAYETIHPEDRFMMNQFYEDLAMHHTGTVKRLRIKMEDGSYRWSELNGIAVFDNKNNPVRKICFIRDVDEVTRQYEDLQARYDYEMMQRGSFEGGVIERVLLDLTENKVIEASNPNTSTLTALIGKSIEDLLAARLVRTEEPEKRAQLRTFMNRENLLQAYYTGKTLTLDLKMPSPEGDAEIYYEASVQVVKNPRNSHIIAFIETRNNDKEKTKSILMRRLLETNYESALVVNARTGKIKIGFAVGDEDFTTDIEKTFEQLATEDIKKTVMEENQEQVMRELSLDTIKAKLAQNKQCSGKTARQVDGQLTYKMWTAAYFDDDREYILITIANITEVYQKDLENARILKDALGSAEQASRAKSTFLARMSHEIRTPITTVSGLMELMKKDCLAEEHPDYKMLKRIETAVSANQYLLTLINDVLDISKIERNEMKITPIVTNTDEVSESLLSMIKPLMEKKHIQLSISRKGKESQWIYMDTVRVKQILMNILSNAVKFTPEGGQIYFSTDLKSEGDSLIGTFAIRDTGVGISEEFRDYVFTPFRQEYEDSRSGYEGSGIGLSISRSLAQMMGGDITFESVKGEGSTFTVTLNFQRAKPPQNHQNIETGTKQTKGARILLCEDNAINRMIAKELLEAIGCIVETAEDGVQAVEVFQNSIAGAIDLIFMDIRMPKMDGLEATRQIRASGREDAKKVPIVAMSANAYEEDRQMSIAAGMNDHLSKPVEMARLQETIRKYVHI